MFKLNRKVVLLPLMALVSGLAPVSPLLASDNCKRVVLTLNNKTKDDIRVKKFEYRDFDKGVWKTEVIFGLDGHQDLEEGKGYTFKPQNLESVLNDTTEFRFTYAHLIGGNKWEPDVTQTTGTFTCSAEMTKAVSLTK